MNDVLTLNETTQIAEVLFEFIKKIPDLPTTPVYEQIAMEAPCITFITESGGKRVINVIGAYDGEVSFSIVNKIKAKDSSNRLGATKLLVYIGSYFDEETKNDRLPFISDRDIAKKLEMVTPPTMIGRDENGDELYSAGYVFTYRHKSKYED